MEGESLIYVVTFQSVGLLISTFLLVRTSGRLLSACREIRMLFWELRGAIEMNKCQGSGSINEKIKAAFQEENKRIAEKMKRI